jgi:hypothetical protein
MINGSGLKSRVYGLWLPRDKVVAFLFKVLGFNVLGAGFRVHAQRSLNGF